MERMGIGLTLFWFIPLALGFVVAVIFMRFSYRQLDETEEDETLTRKPRDKNGASPAAS